jgi:hypothetical protein
MPIIVTCRCGQRLQAPDNLAGKVSKCPKCAASLTVPVAIAAPQGNKPPANNPPAPDPSDPLGLGDLGQYESTMGAADPLGSPAAYGSMGGQMPGQAPMGGPMPAGYGYPQQTAHGYGWPQQPAAASSGGGQWSRRTLLIVVGGAGAFLLLLVGALSAVIIFSYVNADSEVASVDNGDEASSLSTTAPVDPPQEEPAENDWTDLDTTDSEDDPFQSDLESDDEVPDDAASSPAGPMPPSDETGEAEPESQQPPPPTFTAAIEKWRSGDPAKLRGAFAPKDEDFVPEFHSWQTQLLPYLGNQELYDKFRFEQPWSQGQNLKLAHTLVPQFLNPADNRHRWEGYPYNGTALTHYVGMSGVEQKRTDVAAKFPRSDNRAGVFGYDRIAGREEITDGLSQTVMILGSGEMAGPWAQGGGYTVRGARQPYFDPLTGFGSRGLSQGGTLAVFADGSVREISANVSPEVFRAMCTIHGAETVDRAHLGQPLERLPFKLIESPSKPIESPSPSAQQP